jgi:hypothetical protein
MNVVEGPNVGMVVAPPLSMLLKALAAPPRGFSLGSDAGPDNPVLPEFPPLVLL